MERTRNADWSVTFVTMRDCSTVSMPEFVNQVFKLLTNIFVELFGSHSWQFVVRHFEDISCMDWAHYREQTFFKNIFNNVQGMWNWPKAYGPQDILVLSSPWLLTQLDRAYDMPHIHFHRNISTVKYLRKIFILKNNLVLKTLWI